MKRRYKLLLIIFISFILAIIIYLCFAKQKKIYLFIGDDYNNFYSYSFDTLIKNDLKNYEYVRYALDKPNINKLLERLENNEDNINYYLKNANIIILSIGTNELNNYVTLNESIIIDYLNDLYQILAKIHKLNDERIILINLYDNNYSLINKKIKKYTNKFKISYIDETILKNEYQIKLPYQMVLNYQGHQFLYQQIKSLITK